MSSNVCLIRTVSAKTCILVLPHGWGFRAFSQVIFYSGGCGLAAISCLAGGDFAHLKSSQGVNRGGGMLAPGTD